MTSDKICKEDISFYHGGDRILDDKILEFIKQKIGEFSSIKNINFLFGAGTSSGAVPNMKQLKKEIDKEIFNSTLSQESRSIYESIEKDNLEEALNILHAKNHYLNGYSFKGEEPHENNHIATRELIAYIQNEMYTKINVDMDSAKSIKILNLYKRFYGKVAVRNKDLSRINIFTTNNDLFNEKALDSLNINYNNGFGGGIDRYFNPARFNYTLSRKIDHNLEKYEAIEKMVYLYKLHGSINWIQKEGDSFFDIQEISIKSGEKNTDNNHVLIYPTPLKQNQSLGAPYSDLIREFQVKLSQPNSVLFIVGYSFSDEHLNNIIYQALATNSSMSIIIFGEYKNCPLVKVKDKRIYRVFGESENDKIHYFEYIVDKILKSFYIDKDKDLLDGFLKSLNKAKSEFGK
jgi:hypothetical protein